MRKIIFLLICFSFCSFLFANQELENTIDDSEQKSHSPQNQEVIMDEALPVKEKELISQEEPVLNKELIPTEELIPAEELIPTEELIPGEDFIKEDDFNLNCDKEEADLFSSTVSKQEEEVSPFSETTPLSEQDSENSENVESPISQLPIIEKIPLSIVTEDILAREDVEKFRKLYMSEHWLNLLQSDLESAMEYRLFVRKTVQDKGLPEILEYLPVVESNYKTSPRSKSGAVGMWQFMANSVHPFLTLNDFVDQRLDPWYSTEAGLNKLIDNYNFFGDWYLSIAAYNCGGGAMAKAIKASGGVRDYWYLADNGYLPKQTADYIPKLLAIADLAINSQYYGIDLPNHNEEYETLINETNGIFEYVTVNQAYSLKTLAKELRIDQNTMEKLNPSYILGITHPTKESKIRLPIGLGKPAEEALKKITPIDYPFKYKVVSGDSLWSISRKYNVTIAEICELNNIKENDILNIGKILYIP